MQCVMGFDYSHRRCGVGGCQHEDDESVREVVDWPLMQEQKKMCCLCREGIKFGRVISKW